MDINSSLYHDYVTILNEELMPAMGCTEPIAIAYCASIVKKVLKVNPSSLHIIVSGNIIKNVKSVTVPHTNGMHGIAPAAAIGIIAGDCYKELEVIANATNEQINQLPEFLSSCKHIIIPSNNDHTLYIEIIGEYENDKVRVIIQDSHTHVYLVEKNGVILYKNDEEKKRNKVTLDKSVLNIKDIIEFAYIVNIDDVKETLDRQIEYNMAIANEGLKNNYGANVGKTLLKYGDNNLITYCKALAAAGSDARMNGCEMPVVINSGSGNQGITASVPVIAYANKTNKDKDLLYRALVVSNLCTIHIKNSIGKLSAFCGVVIAGACCGAGIAFLEEGHNKESRAISHTIVNALAIISGMVCDGAKSSCAAKIASSVESGIFAYYMYKEGNQFIDGDGIVKKGVENNIIAIGKLARVGMCETDKEIIHLMTE